MAEFQEGPLLPNPAAAQHPQGSRGSSSGAGRWIIRIFGLLVLGGVALGLFGLCLLNNKIVGGFGPDPDAPREKYFSGDRDADDKIAIVRVEGTIMNPLTEQVIEAVRAAADDEDVKGVVLAVDSPGGLVADSHEIYHELKELDKPIVVSMKRIATSGGYYVAMGSGPEGHIFAEPTTWTGSIGVIIPRFDLSSLANKIGIESDPLTTGPYKDALSPFREMTPEETEIWNTIMNEAFERFLTVIADNRPDLDMEAVRKLATGQIYTSSQALESTMVDEIGFLEDAVSWMEDELKLKKVRVVEYEHPQSIIDVLTGSAEVKAAPADPTLAVKALLDASVPQAFYMSSWAPGIAIP